ncbi:DNAJ heat shock N-terminal domain-containing protein [Tieghemostelium lacteum]|uniref:DNAJ heat shock N-terminal domain-containing protein n=1 Tax=Tieghemostelium lacteum TaxID=361077 RepID=A0A151Z3U4_TIELA|nr:DNAJ heat shock N-terminal domain-containing protein [Tieghemostelium lacteum]|eukprot:KYQ88615.1 DNAJ heat shock N-terminal domain-containing protein [Tieghemostelium lacteum]
MTDSPKSLLDYKEEEISALSPGKLKELITAAGGNYTGCLEKDDYVKVAIKVRSTMIKPITGQDMVRAKQQEIKVDYYELLGVSKTATTNEITKAYYKLAKEYHPDKNRNDAYAEEMFKKVSEAYQVLTDPEKRERYDKYGMNAMDETMIDPVELFRMLFGGGMFQDYFGDLSFYDAFSSMGQQEEMDPNKPPQLDMSKMDEKRKERVNYLAKKLEILIEPFIQGNEKEFESMIVEKAKEMANAPGGAELLELIGYVYLQEAKQHSIFGFFHEISEKGHKAKEIFSTISSAAKIQRSFTNEDPTTATIPQQENMIKEGLKLIWKLGRLDIDSVIRDVCERVLDKKADRRKRKVEAVKILGKVFERIGKEQSKLQSGSFEDNIFKNIGSPTSSSGGSYSNSTSPQHTTTTTTSTTTSPHTTSTSPK